MVFEWTKLLLILIVTKLCLNEKQNLFEKYIGDAVHVVVVWSTCTQGTFKCMYIALSIVIINSPFQG